MADRGIGIADDRRFGDLEADLGTRFGYQPARFLDELGIGEPLAGNIDRQPDIVSVARQPLLVLDHLSQRTQRERPDRPRLLRPLDERTCQDPPAGRWRTTEKVR